jgi:diacylglycerol kinase (ATP)
MANDHYFVQLAGIGLDAEVVAKTDWESKKRLGPLSYVLTTTRIMNRRPPELRVHCEKNGSFEGAFVLVGNGRFYGGPWEVFPEADMEDVLLDVCVFEQMSVVALVRYIRGALFGGSHTKFTDVRYFQSRHLVVESVDTVPVEVDGELMGNLPCEFRVLRKKLRVVVA